MPNYPKLKSQVGNTGATLLLMSLALLFAYPFLWMLTAAFRPEAEIFNPWKLWPNHWPLDHYQTLFSGKWIPYPRQYANTLFIAFMQTSLALILCSAAGYLLSQYRFRGRNFWILIAVAVVLIPRQALVLPLFIWMGHLQLLDTPWSVIAPGAVSGIGVLYFLQIYRRLPDELLNLARAEGASEYRLYWMTLPLVKPAFIAYGLIHFVFAWQEHLIPLIMLSSPEQLTLGTALASLQGASLRTPYGLLMAGSSLALIPPLVLFVLLRKHLRSALSDLTVQ